MTSKTSYILCSSTSFKNSQNFRSVSLDSHLTKKVYLARQKLISVIDDLMKTAKENSTNKQIGKSFYLTVEQYQDAIWASKILREADEAFLNNKNIRCLKRPLNLNHINLENENVKINKFGQIYIETSILVQLIELQNALGDIINNLQDTPSDGNSINDVSSYTKTECSDVMEKYDNENANTSRDKSNIHFANLQKKHHVETATVKTNSPQKNNGSNSQSTKMVHAREMEMQKEVINEIFTSAVYPSEGEFLVMSTHTLKHPKSVKHEKTVKQESDKKCSCSKKPLCPLSEERTSSSQINLNTSKCSLRKIKSTGHHGSNQEDLKVTDVAGARDIIVKCISDLDKIRAFFETNRVDVGLTAEVQIQNSHSGPQSKQNIRRSQCCCGGNNEGTAEKSSKIIICIKGKEESEKDVQIIIRKCSECKSEPCSEIGQNKTESEIFCDPCDIPCKPCDLPCDVSFNTPNDPCNIPCDFSCSPPPSAESLHKKNSGLNLMFNPDDPSKSVVESRKSLEKDFATSTSLHNVESGAEPYGRIKLCETTNLCLSTADGQDLIISLTVKPKSCMPAKKISLKDIFSESMTAVEKPKSRICKNNKCPIVNRADRIIPLKRTKICSSLDFDVSVTDTRMRDTGIKHLNQNIVVRLEELGVNNLLRACRPVKCGRQAVLNETLRKCLPYSASLTSLPLEETDADIIDQSLNMSLKKTKENMNKLSYYTQLKNKVSYSNNMQITFLQILYPIIRFPKVQSSENKFIVKKLSFYINLVHDVENTYRKRIHEVRIFEVKRYENNERLKNNANPLQSNMIYRRSNKELNEKSSGQEIAAGEFKVTSNNAKRIIKKIQGQVDKAHSLETTSGSSSTINSMPRQSFKYDSNRHSYNTLAQLKCSKCSPIKKTNYLSSEERKKTISKIPVYKFNRHKDITYEENLECESNIYNVSSQSLPRDEKNIVEDTGTEANNNELPVTVSDRIVLWKPQINLLGTENREFVNYNLEPQPVEVNDKQIIRLDNCPEISIDPKSSEDSFELYFNNYFYDTYFSKPTLHSKQSSARVLKQRRKKSEFLLSKSRSEIYVSASKQDFGYINIATDQIRKNQRVEFSEDNTLSKIKFNKLLDVDLKLSKSTIQYATKVLYEYLLRDTYLRGNMDGILEVKDSVPENYKYKYLDKILSSIKQKIVEGDKMAEHVLDEEPATSNSMLPVSRKKKTIKDTHRQLSQPNVEAGMDEEDVSVQITRIKSINQEINGDHIITNYFENHIRRHALLSSSVTNEHSVQTVLTHGISKCCQMPDINAEMRNQLNAITDLPLVQYCNSCDGFKTFRVTFENKSSTSLFSRDMSSEDIIEEYSLVNDGSNARLRALLRNDYELMKKLMESSWKHMGLEPIEYLVYQNCNCMKSETFMEKLRAKSRSCFKSCKDRVVVKYKNNKCLKGSFEEKLRGKTKSGRDRVTVKYRNKKCFKDYNILICKNCGCYISPSPPKKKLDLTNYCDCAGQQKPQPSQNKPSPRQHKRYSGQYEQFDDTIKPSEDSDNLRHERSNILRSSWTMLKETIKPEKSSRASKNFTQEHPGEHEKSFKGNVTSSSSFMMAPRSHDETGKTERSFRGNKDFTQEPSEHPPRLCDCCIQDPSSSKQACCCCSHKKHKSSCKTRFKSSLKRLPCMSTKKVGNEFCFCRDTKNVGVRCLPDYVNVGVCTNLNEPKKKSYICSHCLGKQDKSVDTKPSSKDLGLQCICMNLEEDRSVSKISIIKDLSTAGNEHSISSTGPRKSQTEEHRSTSSNVSHKSETDNTGFHSTIDDDIDDDYLDSATGPIKVPDNTNDETPDDSPDETPDES